MDHTHLLNWLIVCLYWVDVWPGYHFSRPFRYCAMRQEERRNKQKTIKYVDQPKRDRFYRTCKLHYEKKNLQEKITPSTLVHPISPSQKFSLTKALSRKIPLNPWSDRCPLSRSLLLLFSQCHAALSLPRVFTVFLGFGLTKIALHKPVHASTGKTSHHIFSVEYQAF